jgi:hypothetical protein
MRRLVIVAVAWFGAAFALGLSGLVGKAPFLVPVIFFGTVTAGIVVYARRGEIRRALDDIDLRWPILLHTLRAPIGAFLLLQGSRGVLPPLFANRAGPGDIAVGLLAAIVATMPSRRGVVAAWSVFGMADLALAFGTGQYLLFVVHDPRVSLIGELPYTLLPAFLVPAMMLSHLLVLNRLRASSPVGAARRAPPR